MSGDRIGKPSAQHGAGGGGYQHKDSSWYSIK